MFFYYAVRFVGLLIFFLFGASYVSAAGKACYERNWSAFGADFMLALVNIGGMLWILGLI